MRMIHGTQALKQAYSKPIWDIGLQSNNKICVNDERWQMAIAYTQSVKPIKKTELDTRVCLSFQFWGCSS